MDLAHALGKNLTEVKQFSEKEFLKWDKYAKTYSLPQRRLELYLAQIALWVARGTYDVQFKLEDFLFDPPEDAKEVSAEEALKNDMEALGFDPK